MLGASKPRPTSSSTAAMHRTCVGGMLSSCTTLLVRRMPAYGVPSS